MRRYLNKTSFLRSIIRLPGMCMLLVISSNSFSSLASIEQASSKDQEAYDWMNPFLVNPSAGLEQLRLLNAGAARSNERLNFDSYVLNKPSELVDPINGDPFAGIPVNGSALIFLAALGFVLILKHKPKEYI